MLASLLPGLRDVRVPLTVGYLWLLNAWLWFSGCLPENPPKSGLAGRAVDLGELVGPAGVLAAVSFGAYVVGALLLLPGPARLPVGIQALFPIESSDSKTTRDEYQLFLGQLGASIENRSNGLSPSQYDEVAKDAHRATGATADELRPRLLVANQDLFGEFDRLASEGQFRLNIAWPLLALGATVSAAFSWWWMVPTALVFYTLLTQGLRKSAQAVSVIQRAVLTGLVTHPLQSILSRWA